MDAQRWKIVEARFQEALTRPTADREAFLQHVCKGDPELLAEVISLLKRNGDAAAVLGCGGSVSQLLDGDETRAQESLTELPLSGRTLSHYCIGEKLGQGGMGVVWKAVDTNLRREVAMKVLPRDGSFDVGRFLREGQMASALNHPNIVTIYEASSAEGIHYIAMELVRGVTLADRILGGRVPAAEALQIGVQVSDALAHAHAAGVIHRDLKPSNIMITPAGVAKVLDFGIAKHQALAAAASSEDRATLTAPAMVRGTLAYMSPEQLMGEDVDGRSDLFSFGLVLYELLTGSRPFTAGEMSPIRALLEAAPSAPRSIAPDLPHSLERIVLRCLEKDPKNRPQSAAELSSELRSLLTAAPSHRVKWPLYAGASTLIALALTMIAPIRHRLFATPPSHAIGEAPRNEIDYYRLARARLDRYDKRANVPKAIEYLEQAIRINPQYAPAYAALSEAYLRRNDIDPDKQWLNQAREAATEAAALNPDLATAHIALAASRFADGRSDEADAEFSKARVLEPRNARAIAGLAKVEAHKDPAASERLFRTAVQLAPGDIYIAGEFGVHLYNLARYGEAIDVWKKSLESSPDNVRALRNIGAAYDRLGQYEEAASVYQRALELEQSATVYSNLGAARFSQGRYRESVEAFEKAVQLGGSSYLRWGNLGNAYRCVPGMRSKAGEAYARAIELAKQELVHAPMNSNLRAELATYLAFSGDRAAALTQLTAFEQLREKTPQSLFNSAVAYEACSQRERAIHLLGDALRASFPRHLVENEPELAELRSDARYQRMLAEIRNAPVVQK